MSADRSRFLNWYRNLVFATPQMTDTETSSLARERDIHAANENIIEMQNDILKIAQGNLHSIYNAYASVQVETEILEEIFQLGYFILLRCATNWDHRRGVPFRAYVYYSLRRFLPSALRQAGRQGLAGAAQSRQELRRLEKHYAQHGAQLSDQDAARLLGWRQQRVTAARCAASPNTLDAPIRHRAAARIDGVLAEERGHPMAPDRVSNIPQDEGTPEDIMMKNERFRQVFQKGFSLLTNSQRTVVILRYGLRKKRYDQDRTLKEVGKLIRLSTERVRNIERQALRNLRDHLLEIDKNL